MSINAETLIKEFRRMYDEHWQYIWGHHEEGIVDCSGAFYYSFKKHGLPMYNGSNRIARVYTVGGLIPIDKARREGLILPGMAAFKHYTDNDKGYNLGSGYKPNGAYYNGDLRDYHHIGLIDTDIKYVLNAQSAKTGFVRSKITENWTYVARLKNVEYSTDGKEVKKMEEKEMLVSRATDTSSSTNTVNMRANPDTSATVLQKVKFGSVVIVTQKDGDWAKVSFGGKTGWMMAKFLQDIEGEKPDIMSRLQAIYDELGDILGLRG